ncbi:MAG: hypothetical protein B6D44_15190 [Ignavibacteriales bacterium UTCHB2]|jgi:predicted transcriptional regulator|nr:MAG: hypothetical protein B6D44_15190 [Ignavibacteriales bacterium UTCHB2]
MKLKDLLKKLFPDKASEIEQLEEDQPKTEPPKVEQPNTKDEDGKKYYEMIKAENEKLLTELAAIKKRDEEREKLLQQKAIEENKTKISEAIKKAIDDKKIPAKDDKTIASYTKLLEADFENGLVALNALPKIVDNNNNNKEVPPAVPPKKADKPILATILERNEITTN